MEASCSRLVCFFFREITVGTFIICLTVNLDTLRQYRPTQNVLNRSVAKGQGHDIAGHHEILLPLLRQAIIERYPGT